MGKKNFQSGIDSVFSSTAPAPSATSVAPEQASPSSDKERMITGNFKMPASLQKELKMLAVEKETTMMELIAVAIREYIERNK